MENKLKIYPETAPFVEALRLLLQAEDKILEGFTGIYGDGFSDGEGDTHYRRSGIPEALDSVKGKVKEWIGNTFELGLCGQLEEPIKTEE